MPFRVLKELGDRFEVEGDTGLFKIAKKGLSASTHARLRAALEEEDDEDEDGDDDFARGGMVRSVGTANAIPGMDEGGEVDTSNTPVALQTDDPGTNQQIASNLRSQGFNQQPPNLPANIASNYAPDAGSIALMAAAYTKHKMTGESYWHVLNQMDEARSGRPNYGARQYAEFLGTLVPVSAGTRLAQGLAQRFPRVSRALEAAPMPAAGHALRAAAMGTPEGESAGALAAHELLGAAVEGGDQGD